VLPPPGYGRMAPQQIEHTFQPPKGYKLKKKRRWPWVLLAIVVVLGVISAVAKPKDDEPAGQRVSTPAGGQSGAPNLAAGQADTTSGFSTTLIQTVDPWVSTNQFESPAAGKRYVAVELTMVNTSSEPQTFSTLLGLEVVDSLGQHWNPTFAGLDLPQLGGDLAPGAMIRGWQVFEVGVDSTGLQLVVKGSLTASGITFTL